MEWNDISVLPEMIVVDERLKHSKPVLVTNGLHYDIACCEVFDDEPIWQPQNASDCEITGLIAWMELPKI